MAAQAARLAKPDRQRLSEVETTEKNHAERLSAIETTLKDVVDTLLQIRAIGRFLAWSWGALVSLAIITGAIVGIIRLAKGI